MKVFLGGTCNNSTWRSDVISLLTAKNIKYFNPVVPDWNDEAIAKEQEAKRECNIHLYTITPKLSGVYNIAETIESLFTDGVIVIFNVLPADEDMRFSQEQIKSLVQVGKMVTKHKGVFVSGIDQLSKAIEGVLLLGSKPEALAAKPKIVQKTLHNSDISGAEINVPDIQKVGNGDMFRLLCKASSEKEGWMKSTKAMDTENGCVIQVTTQQRNPDGSYAIGEALTFVPDVHTEPDGNGRRLAI